MDKVAELQEKLNHMDHKELVDFALHAAIQRDNYYEQLMVMNHRKFKSNSEKASFYMPSLFNEMEATVDQAVEEELTETVIVTRKKKSKHIGSSKAADFSHLKKVTIEHEKEDKTCPDCGSQLKETAPTKKYTLKYKPPEYWIQEDIYHNYVCPTCTEKNDAMKRFSADDEKEERLIEKSIVDASVVAGIATNKFVLGIPLDRQEKDLKRQNVKLPKQTMSNWLMKCCELYLMTVFDWMWKDARKLEVGHMDETTLKVIEDIHKENRYKDYVWLLMSGRFEEKQMALYFFKKDRKYDNVEKILGKRSQMIIHSDGYGAYHDGIGKMTVGCLAHVRRKFEEAQVASPCYKEFKSLKTKDERIKYLKEHPGYEKIIYILSKIQELFKIEKELNKADASPKEILEKRTEESEAIVNELFACIETMSYACTKKSKLGRAVGYALGQEPFIRNYLTDGRTEISNNRAERAIKPFVMARKNFLFSNTKSGARCSAVYFSLIESAKMNNLNPMKYLEYVLKTLSTKGLHDEIIESVLPYSKTLPVELYVKIN